jgi:predicted Zn-dependent peptidase
MGFRYERDVLPSGLRVVTLETPHLHTALVAAYVRAGSRHETAQTNGVGHFLEHMLFRGSRGFPDPRRMNALVEDAGGNLNGITTRDHGYYYTPIHPDHLDLAIAVLGDMLTRPLLEDMEIERRVILEEMLDEVDETGADIDVDNLAKRELFGAHPLGFKIAGTRETVKGLTRPQLEEHLGQFYVAPNLVVAVAGRVRREEVLGKVEQAFAHLPTRPPLARETAPPPSPGGPWVRLVEHDEAQTEFRLVFPTVAESHPDYPALQLLRRVLDDGLSSRLPFRVVETQGLAYSVQAGLEAYADTGLFEVDAASAPLKAAEVLTSVCEVLSEVASAGVTEEELTRAKRRYRMFLEFAQDAPGELAGWFGATELFRQPESFEERARLLDQQSPEALRAVARRYLTRDRMGLVAVGQRKGFRALERAVAEAPLNATG